MRETAREGVSEGVREKVLATHMFLSSKYAVHCGNILRRRVSRRHDNLKMKVAQLRVHRTIMTGVHDSLVILSSILSLMVPLYNTSECLIKQPVKQFFFHFIITQHMSHTLITIVRTETGNAYAPSTVYSTHTTLLAMEDTAETLAEGTRQHRGA